MDEASDRLLVEQTRGGQIDAFGELVRRYQTSVFNVCYRLLGDPAEAEDLTQDAFLRAYRRLESYDVDRPFGPWMRRVAANLCLNAMQRREPPTVQIDEEFDQAEDEEPRMPEAALVRRASAERVRSALHALPPHYRMVIELRHYQEMRYDDIAAELGLTLAEVKTRLYRARRAIANLLVDPEHG
ncbi:MAG TPA: sigma-70 family RNA polymerase sigma factor [Anaerolineales bacterium]|nr:sigma-70 family RNA polymerase sigma factor [Anaerolineales bacterium]